MGERWDYCRIRTSSPGRRRDRSPLGYPVRARLGHPDLWRCNSNRACEQMDLPAPLLFRYCCVRRFFGASVKGPITPNPGSSGLSAR